MKEMKKRDEEREKWEKEEKRKMIEPMHTLSWSVEDWFPSPSPQYWFPSPNWRLPPQWLDSCYATCRLYSVFCMILDSDDGITFDIIFMVKYRGWQKCWYI